MAERCSRGLESPPPRSPCPPPSGITPARSARSSACRRSFPPASAAPSCRSHPNQGGLLPEGGQRTRGPPSTSAEAIPADRIHRTLVVADNGPRGDEIVRLPGAFG